MKSETKFLNCKINLSKKVFQPRIETAFWVGKAIKEIKQKAHCSHTATNKKPTVHTQQETRILDIFAGSGCIGIAILKSIDNSAVDFVDIDKEALEQIKINLKINKIPKNRYRIFQSDLFEKLKREKFDFIFANPPYIALNRISEVETEVLEKEPHLALLGGEKGMDYIKKFFSQAKKHLNPKARIFLEFDPLQKEEIEEILRKNKYRNWQFQKDQYRKWRYLMIK